MRFEASVARAPARFDTRFQSPDQLALTDRTGTWAGAAIAVETPGASQADPAKSSETTAFRTWCTSQISPDGDTKAQLWFLFPHNRSRAWDIAGKAYTTAKKEADSDRMKGEDMSVAEKVGKLVKTVTKEVEPNIRERLGGKSDV